MDNSAGGMQSNVVPGSAEDLKVNVGDTVHFEYDKYSVRDDDRALLQRQAAWLSKYPAVRVTVEGHCDERGTREYNLALGARRANAVKEYLVSKGVNSSRVETISYGKERPMCARVDRRMLEPEPPRRDRHHQRRRLVVEKRPFPLREGRKRVAFSGRGRARMLRSPSPKFAFASLQQIVDPPSRGGFFLSLIFG